MSDKDLSKLYQLVSEFQVTKHQIKSSLLSSFSKELFGYPPGKNKPGKSPNLKKITQILELFNE